MKQFVLSVLVLFLAFIIYAFAAYPTIAWWDNAEYITCAHTLGITFPPGSIVLVLTGRLFARFLTAFDPAYRVNLMVALLGALSILLVYRSTVLLMKKWGSSHIVHISAILGAFTTGFTLSLWRFTEMASAYGLSLFFSALIIWISLKWWDEAEEAHAERWLMLILFLLGLDIGVHRNNLLLIPALLFMVLLRKPRVFTNWKLWLAAPMMWFLGFSMHAVFLVRSNLNPPIDATNPETLQRFWDWLNLKGVGSGLLPNFFQRKAPFWDYQIQHMYLRYLNWNFLGRETHAIVYSLKGLYGIPAVMGLCGLLFQWFKSWKKAAYLLAAFIMTSLGAVVYLNVPPAYFREIDRHFLASFLVFGLWVGIGVYGFLTGLRSLSRGNEKATLLGVLLLIVLLPVNMFRTNLYENNKSENYYTYDFAHNLLQTCEPDAILFTNGDSDTFPLWYLQIVEGIRKDVSVINIPLLGAPWWRQQLREKEPDFPVDYSRFKWEHLEPKEWDEQTVSIEVPDHTLREFGIESVPPEDTLATQELHTMAFIVPPSFGGDHLLPNHQIILNILKTNAWERPVYFANTVSQGHLVGLQPFLRTDGLARRLTPIENPPLHKGLLEWHLLRAYQYRNTNSSRVYVDEVSGPMLSNYKNIFLRLAQDYALQHQGEDCLTVLKRMEELFPRDRFPDPSPQFTSMVEEMYRRFVEDK